MRTLEQTHARLFADPSIAWDGGGLWRQNTSWRLGSRQQESPEDFLNHADNRSYDQIESAGDPPSFQARFESAQSSSFPSRSALLCPNSSRKSSSM